MSQVFVKKVGRVHSKEPTLTSFCPIQNLIYLGDRNVDGNLDIGYEYQRRWQSLRWIRVCLEDYQKHPNNHRTERRSMDSLNSVFSVLETSSDNDLNKWFVVLIHFLIVFRVFIGWTYSLCKEGWRRTISPSQERLFYFLREKRTAWEPWFRNFMDLFSPSKRTT